MNVRSGEGKTSRYMIYRFIPSTHGGMDTSESSRPSMTAPSPARGKRPISSAGGHDAVHHDMRGGYTGGSGRYFRGVLVPCSPLRARYFGLLTLPLGLKLLASARLRNLEPGVWAWTSSHRSQSAFRVSTSKWHVNLWVRLQSKCSLIRLVVCSALTVDLYRRPPMPYGYPPMMYDGTVRGYSSQHPSIMARDHPRGQSPMPFPQHMQLASANGRSKSFLQTPAGSWTQPAGAMQPYPQTTSARSSYVPATAEDARHTAKRIRRD